MVAVLVVAIVAVLEAVQVALGAWSAIIIVTIVHGVIDVTIRWLVAFHVLKCIVVVLHLENVSLDVIDVLVVAIHAMMYIVGVIGLLVVVVAAELETEYNVQIMLNYLSSIVNYKFGNH